MQNSELALATMPALAQTDAEAQAATSPVLAYYATLSKNSERSARSYAKKIAAILGYDDALLVPWHKLTYAHTQVVRKRLTEIYPPSTCNTALAVFKNLLKTAWRLGLMNSDQYLRATDLPRVKGSRIPAGRKVTQDELAALFADCRNDRTHAGPRDAAILALLAGCGLRREEVANLLLENYNPQTGELRVIGKGDKERVVFATNGTKSALQAWLNTRQRARSEYLFTSITKYNTFLKKLTGNAVWLIIQKRCHNTGIPKFTPHDLRRTFVTNLLQDGTDIKTVSDMAGHANIATTAIYDRRNTDTQKHAANSIHIPYTN